MSRKVFAIIAASINQYTKVLSLCVLLLALTYQSATNAVAAPPAQPQPFTPFLDIVPNANGSSVNVTVREAETTTVTVFAAFTDPTGFKEGWTGTYSSTVDAHLFVNVGLYTPNTTMTNSVQITTSNGLALDNLVVNRSFLPAQESAFALSADNQVELEIFNDDTFATDTYVVIVKNPTLPGALPPDLHLLGNSYNVRASGQLLNTQMPMDLRFRFTADQLGDLDPHTFAIYKWDINAEEWQLLPPSLANDDGPVELSSNTQEFATYAVLARPLWSARLDNEMSLDLDQSSNIFVGGLPRGLRLDATPGVGVGLSTPITPPFGLQSWGSVEFSGTSSAPATALTVDVLDADGALLLSNVASGQSLAAIDPVANPSLRLRANLTSTVANQSPLLLSWGVSWSEPPANTAPANTETENAATARSAAPANSTPVNAVTIQTSDATAEVGETVSISLTLANLPPGGISGATIDVSYDPALLQLDGCVPLEIAGAIVNCNQAFNSDALAPDAARISFIVSPSLTLTTVIAHLNFALVSDVATEEAAINVEAVRVTDGAGNRTTAQARGSIITIARAPIGNASERASGDLNCDETVDSSDIELIIAYEAGLVSAGESCPLEPDQLLLAECDLNQDQACTLQDAWLMLP